jgi:uncharacterized membrane protein YhaH (DUF805 family)
MGLSDVGRLVTAISVATKTSLADQSSSGRETTIMSWYLQVLKRYAVFSERSQRMEYWMFSLFYIIFGILIGIIDSLLGAGGEGGGLLSLLFILAMIIPSLAVTFRRLHDTDHSGWWLLIGFVPLIGMIILLIFMVQDSQAGANQYGPNPKVATA